MWFKLRKLLYVFKIGLYKRYLNFHLKRQSIEGEFVFVSGADSSHFESAKQLLRSYLKFEKESKLIFYDLGLTQEENTELRNHFPNVIFKKFDYSKYPDYFDIKKNAGEYAWKPVIVWDTLSEYKCKVMWMDAGNLITNNLDRLKKYLCLRGYFWNPSLGTIEEWTHDKTLSYFDVPKRFYSCRNLSAAAVGFDYENEKVRQLAFDWKECALCKDCIAPEGSNRDNHRQDQAVLTILVYKKNLAGKIRLRESGFLIQQDIDEVLQPEAEN